MENPGAKLKLSMNEFMGKLIDEAYQFAPNEFVFKRFRKNVLDAGNQLIREMNEELSKHNVHYNISFEEMKRAQATRSEDKASDFESTAKEAQ